MNGIWNTSIRFTLLTTLVFGLAYPLLVTAAAHAVFPRKANGSLIVRNGGVIGSSLIAQSFDSDGYFHSRPSAAGSGYDAENSGGSNLAQSSAQLVHRIQGAIDSLRAENSGSPVPIDLVTTSGSGLDPDITPDAALYQAPRVARARGLSVELVRQLVLRHVTPRAFGLLGEPRVNVLELNLDLNRLSGNGASAQPEHTVY
ncbi:MAG TPA: potassium-transporting ATPase subunit KdpC [Terracidiphilus sp.]|nr:potassium-transporting ATPase subunit KdpC [Terracidiphilus sp.]